MEPSYTVLGGDGNQYGPVTLDQLKAWMREGRIDATSQILRSDVNAWQPASGLVELTEPALQTPGAAIAGGTLAPALAQASPSHTAALSAEMMELEKRIKGGASWYYWIAALTLINTVVIHSGSEMSFVLGLMISQFVDFFAIQSSEPVLRGVALALDALAIGVFVLFGVFAHKKHLWAFAIGMAIYGIDTVLVLISQLWLGVAIHAFAMFSLFIALKSTLRWKELMKTSGIGPSA